MPDRPSRITQALRPGDGKAMAGGSVQPLNFIRWSAVALVLGAAPAFAQAPADFYRGKTIELDIGLSVGGAYDAYARMLARTMSKYIPGNPAIVPRNMEGAGSMRLPHTLRQTEPTKAGRPGEGGRPTAIGPGC